MNIIDKFSLIFLIILFLIQVFKKNIFKKIVFIWVLAVIGIFLFGIIESVNRYFLWKEDPIFKFLIPPYKNINYFIYFVFIRFFSYWILALVAALILNKTALFFNKKYNERFFEPEEIPFATLGMFLSGWPGFLFYFCFVLIFGLILSIIYTIKNKGRAPLYYIWLPAAILAILFKNFVIPFNILKIFIIS
ncbi:MAG: hypothetical protein N2Z85_00325 [Patescibacteria group bacterium]|nr:hypothetical protein [Patescibacteria group bacterium]